MPVIVVMGVSGSGKTTVGQLLAERLGWQFIDADAHHPQENVAKMAKGIPLSDSDRAPWLRELRRLISNSLESDEPLVLACSALRARYREQLAQGDSRVRFVYLRGSTALIYDRLTQRSGHFMKSDLLQSQFSTLEEPEDALTLDIGRPPVELVEQIVQHLANESA